MRWCLGLFIVIAVSLAAPKEANADLIFLNMNGSTTEIPAAQDVANQLGEKLYVLPSTNTPGYETQQLSQDLVRLAKLGVRPRAMIVSGHHVKNQGYFGKNGEVSLHFIGNYISREDNDVAAFFASLQSLYLWGCYTGTLTNVDRLLVGYNTPFLNTKYVVGFADKAPLSTVPASGQVLREILLREGQLRAASPAKMSELVKQISASYGDKYDFIVHKGKAFLTKDGYSEVHNFIESCQSPESRERLLQSVLLVWKYYWNEIGPLPEETGKGPLREAYRHLQRNDFCVQMGAVQLSQVEEIPPVSTVIRLIYYKHIVQNFARVYGTALQYAQSEMNSLGLTDIEFITKLPQTERGVAIKNLERLHKELKKVLPGYKSDVEQRSRYLYFNSMINDIESVIYPSEDYVPQSWIDPSAKERAWFPVLNDFTKAQARFQKKAQKQLTAPN